MPFMPSAYDEINRLEMDAKAAYPKSIAYPITFDGSNKPLRLICDPPRFSNLYEPTVIYRRVGVTLTRDQAAELIHRQQHASKAT